jgi:hypothetical protein
LLLVTRHSSLFFTAAAHEVNDLDAVAFVEGRLLPVGAADDPLIQFNREAFGRKREVRDEFGHSDGSGYVSRFAVDLDLQVFQSSFQTASGLMNNAAEFSSLAAKAGVDEDGGAP